MADKRSGGVERCGKAGWIAHPADCEALRRRVCFIGSDVATDQSYSTHRLAFKQHQNENTEEILHGYGQKTAKGHGEARKTIS